MRHRLIAMSTKRGRHHFLPRYVLAHFADADGRVRFCRRSAGWRESSSGPRRLGREEGLYSPGVQDLWGREPSDDSLELWLDRSVDTPAADPIKRVVSGAAIADLNGNERHALAQFIAVLDMRTPAARDLLAQNSPAGRSSPVVTRRPQCGS